MVKHHITSSGISEVDKKLISQWGQWDVKQI